MRTSGEKPILIPDSDFPPFFFQKNKPPKCPWGLVMHFNGLSPVCEEQLLPDPYHYSLPTAADATATATATAF